VVRFGVGCFNQTVRVEKQAVAWFDGCGTDLVWGVGHDSEGEVCHDGGGLFGLALEREVVAPVGSVSLDQGGVVPGVAECKLTFLGFVGEADRCGQIVDALSDRSLVQLGECQAGIVFVEISLECRVHPCAHLRDGFAVAHDIRETNSSDQPG